MRRKHDISASGSRINRLDLERGWAGESVRQALLVSPHGDCQGARRSEPTRRLAHRRRVFFTRSLPGLPGSQPGTHNKAVERTAAPLGRDEVPGNWTGTGFGERRGRAAVAHLDRSVSLTRPADLQGSTAEHRTGCSESDRLLMPTFDVTDGSARSASNVAGSGIRTGQTGASGGRISSPPRIFTDLISERTR